MNRSHAGAPEIFPYYVLNFQERRNSDFVEVRVGAVEKLQSAQRASLAELDALFASLQQRAFRGEVS